MKTKGNKGIKKNLVNALYELQQNELQHLEREFKDYKKLYPTEKKPPGPSH